MKEIIYNNDDLKNEDITENVIRCKALLIRGDDIIIENENGIYQFPGGHLEKNESIQDCLKREILEETGIELEDKEINDPFMKVVFLNKDWPEVGKNRKNEIYYYAVKTNKEINYKNIKLTEYEKNRNLKIEKFKLTDVINVIKENIPNNPKNDVIASEMITALEEYFKIVS